MDERNLRTGFLAEGDIVSLSYGLHVRGNTLIDQAAAAHHTLQAETAQAISLFREGCQVQFWLHKVKSLGISEKQAADLLRFLYSIGAITIRRSLRSHLAYRLDTVTNIVVGGYNLPPLRRYPHTLYGVMRALVASSFPILASMPIIGMLLYGAGIALDLIFVCGTIFYTGLLIGIGVHEVVHLIVLNDPDAVIVRRGLRLGVLHKKASQGKEYMSAILGPVSGIIVSLSYTFIAARLLHQSLIYMIGVGLALFHAASWLPVYGDGKVFLQNRRRSSL